MRVLDGKNPAQLRAPDPFLTAVLSKNFQAPQVVQVFSINLPAYLLYHISSKRSCIPPGSRKQFAV